MLSATATRSDVNEAAMADMPGSTTEADWPAKALSRGWASQSWSLGHRGKTDSPNAAGAEKVAQRSLPNSKGDGAVVGFRAWYR